MQAAEGAFSANTERAVKADLGIYTAWCAGQGRPALPASPATITAFVDAMVRSLGHGFPQRTGDQRWHVLPNDAGPTNRFASADPARC